MFDTYIDYSINADHEEWLQRRMNARRMAKETVQFYCKNGLGEFFPSTLNELFREDCEGFGFSELTEDQDALEEYEDGVSEALRRFREGAPKDVVSGLERLLAGA